ncbi:hypothetical protein N9894_04910, partial [Akkermansiaceae bacterium]|nr:hypothetical protein [Akkermansiaceae bacterium]
PAAKVFKKELKQFSTASMMDDYLGFLYVSEIQILTCLYDADTPRAGWVISGDFSVPAKHF